MTKHDVYGPICSAEGCERPHRSHGYCGMHWMRLKASGDLRGVEPESPGRKPVYVPCAVEGCDEKVRGKGYCQMHYQRWKRLGHTGPVGKIVRGRYKDTNGYIVVRKEGNRKILEHRLVMEQQLGRELQPRENIHHVNGVKDDNRPENLELWVKPQPQGQRVRDLVAWVVKSYPEETRKVLEEIEHGTS